MTIESWGDRQSIRRATWKRWSKGGIRAEEAGGHVSLTLALCIGVAALGLGSSSMALHAQQAADQSAAVVSIAGSTSSGTAVPRLIKFGGVVRDSHGRAAAGMVGLTLSLYELPEGGAPLWVETQKVQLDSRGQYTLLLGAASASGLPLDLFASSKALWLGIQPQLPGAAEQPRVLLVAVPYALKAADADTLGGRPLSAFVLAPSTDASSPAATSPNVTTNTDSSVTVAARTAAAAAVVPLAACTPTADGTAAATQVAIYSGACTLTKDAGLVDVGGKVGLGMTAPFFKLDISDAGGVGEQIRSTSPSESAVLRLTSGNSPGSGTSHADLQFYDGSTQAFRFLGAVGNTTNRYGGFIAYKDRDGKQLPLAFFTSDVNNAPQVTLWMTGGQAAGTAGNVGVGTLTPSARLEVNGTTKFDGLATFAASQIFPGTLTGATAGGGLVTSGSTIGLTRTCAIGQILSWNGSAWACTVISGGGSITGVLAGTDLTGGGSSGTVTLNLDGTKVPRLAAANTFTADQTVNANLNVIAGGIGATALSVQATDLTSANTAISGLVDGANGTGVVGEADNGSTAIGIWGISSGGVAGQFSGNVNVTGTLTKSGGSFKIDDPIDPANKYLYHSFVESPEMTNLYNGNAILDANGEALVQLPAWFEALNRDFRYQLSCIGGFAPVYIAQEVSHNQFKIAGGKPGMKVSWQVTGVRQDAWANANRIPVEVEKPASERGYYLHPELFGHPRQRGVDWAGHGPLMQHLERGSKKPANP